MEMLIIRSLIYERLLCVGHCGSLEDLTGNGHTQITALVESMFGDRGRQKTSKLYSLLDGDKC